MYKLMEADNIRLPECHTNVIGKYRAHTIFRVHLLVVVHILINVMQSNVLLQQMVPYKHFECIHIKTILYAFATATYLELSTIRS